MKILTVIGARPQFIKAAPLSQALASRASEVLVHTGQHYDAAMSDVFFSELGIPRPEYNLAIGSGAHGEQTGAMLAGLERVMLEESPELVLVYGDTNSTLAGSLAAAKLHVPIAHVEAGVRSHNRAMPEEINRIVTDRLSTILLAPSSSAKRELAREGIVEGVHVVGDIMLDVLLEQHDRARETSRYPAALGVAPRSYFLCTVHRAENTDDEARLRSILAALDGLRLPVVVPVHPRTRRQMQRFGLEFGKNVIAVEPVGYLDMLQLQAESVCILTDSGGVQKEAYYLGVRCVTLRDETEWVETVATGWNCVVGTATDAIVAAANDGSTPVDRPGIYGTGNTASQIARILCGA